MLIEAWDGRNILVEIGCHAFCEATSTTGISCDALILSLSVNVVEEGEHPVYVDILLGLEFESLELPFAPTFRGVSAQCTSFSQKIYIYSYVFLPLCYNWEQ